MINTNHQLPNIHYPWVYEKYFEIIDEKEVRVFGKCEVTHKEFEVYVPLNLFCAYLEGNKKVYLALPNEALKFIVNGVSPEGWEELFPKEK